MYDRWLYNICLQESSKYILLQLEEKVAFD